MAINIYIFVTLYSLETTPTPSISFMLIYNFRELAENIGCVTEGKEKVPFSLSTFPNTSEWTRLPEKQRDLWIRDDSLSKFLSQLN